MLPLLRLRQQGLNCYGVGFKMLFLKYLLCDALYCTEVLLLLLLPQALWPRLCLARSPAGITFFPSQVCKTKKACMHACILCHLSCCANATQRAAEVSFKRRISIGKLCRGSQTEVTACFTYIATSIKPAAGSFALTLGAFAQT